MNKTTNFEFNLPEGTDNVDIEILNANMDKLDELFADIYSKLPTPPQPVITEFVIDTTDPNNYIVSEERRMIYNSFDTMLGLTVGDTWSVLIHQEGREDTTQTLQVTNQGDEQTVIPTLIIELGCLVVDGWSLASDVPTPIDVGNWMIPCSETEQGLDIPEVVLTFTKQ